MKKGNDKNRFLSISVVDRHIVLTNFHFDADRDPEPDWHQNNADPHADRGGKITLIHSCASLQRFYSPIKCRCVMILSIFEF